MRSKAVILARWPSLRSARPALARCGQRFYEARYRCYGSKSARVSYLERSMKFLALMVLAAPLGGLVLAQSGPSSPLPGVGTAAAFPQVATLLKLRDGSVRWGEIVSHDPDGFVFRLLAHGGEVTLGWSALDPGQEAELREAFGYVDVVSEELMIEADSMVLTDGRELVGVILSREGPNFLLKAGGNLQAIPKRRVVSLSRGKWVPAVDVYSREEIYSQHLATLDDSNAASHLELAQVCERVLDFVKATIHYEAALAIGELEDEAAVRHALTRAKQKAAQQQQIDYLRQADTLRKRGRFDEALQLLGSFSANFPGSPLATDATEKLVRAERLRDEAARQVVQSRWSYWAKRLARTKQGELGLDAAQAYATDGLTEAIQERVFEDVKNNVSEAIPEEAIPEYWATRRKRGFSSTSYGKGTWLLGKERARAGTAVEEEKEEAETKSAKQLEREAFARKLKRFQDNQQRAARARGNQDDAEEAAAFWDTMSGNARASWLFSYYVEFAGVYELRDHPHTPNCTTCGGTGGREVVAIGGGGANPNGARGQSQVNSGSSIVACPICRGVAVKRRIYYR